MKFILAFIPVTPEPRSGSALPDGYAMIYWTRSRGGHDTMMMVWSQQPLDPTDRQPCSIPSLNWVDRAAHQTPEYII